MIFLIRSNSLGFMDKEFNTCLDLNDQSAPIKFKHRVILLIISGLIMYIHISQSTFNVKFIVTHETIRLIFFRYFFLHM